ncbi:MAG: YbbR-like domain-containing protein [Spirochaetia bacterium]
MKAKNPQDSASPNPRGTAAPKADSAAARLRRVFLADMPIKVICLAAAVILLLFHRVTTLTERFFSVPLEVTTPAGLAVASAFPKTVRITLRGPGDAIFPILEDDVEASVNLESHHVPGVYRADVKVDRKGTAQEVEPLEIRVDPQAVTFTLEPLAEKRVVLSPDLKGAPAYGYQLVQTGINPQNVVIWGAKSRVQSVTSLSTEEIDLTGRTDSFAAKVKILLPNTLLKIAGDAAVDFRATIQEETVQHSFDGVAVTPVDLSPHLAVKTAPAVGSVKVQGTQLAVDAVRPEQVRLAVDLGTVRRAGVYTLQTRPDEMPGIMVLDWSPRQVTLDIVASGSQEGSR